MVRMPVSAGKARATRARTVAVFGKKKAAAPKAAPKAAPGKRGAPVQQRGAVPAPGVGVKQYLGLGTSVNPFGFSKANELFVGRMAMLGFSAGCLGEILTGKGILAQFDIETGLPLNETEPLLLGLIAFNVIVALTPGFGKFVPAEENLEDDLRPEALSKPNEVTLLQPRRFFGLSEKGLFAFSKANELFVGRMAMLGFSAALIGELQTGVGPLEQLGFETGIPLYEVDDLLLFSIIFTAVAALLPGTGKFVDENGNELV